VSAYACDSLQVVNLVDLGDLLHARDLSARGQVTPARGCSLRVPPGADPEAGRHLERN
jgi:hypothetical protein